MKRQILFERECIHRENGTEGEVYNGMFFVQALQRLQSEDALKIAAKVSPFYWVDAPRVVVWLCRDCVAELNLGEVPGRCCRVRDDSVSDWRRFWSVMFRWRAHTKVCATSGF